ncbi:P-loop containing nucleoside triphosphate hydrolase protein [Mycena filopes]|nr:P-loop containing nucleoside triphosphate hydrolase protein [Mycena filopes]
MQRAPRLTDLLEYTLLAASTLTEIARSIEIPFLLTAASLTSMILEFVRESKTTKQYTIQIVEQIHEILCAIIGLYSENVVSQMLPPSLLYDIGRFTDTLQKIYTFMKRQGDMGKIQQLLKHADNALQLDACKAGLQAAMDALRIQTGASMVSGMGRIKKNVQEQHVDLLELLAAHRDIASSDSTSVGMSSTFSTSIESFAMFPASPKIFHGREVELTQILHLLSQQFAHIAILGPGGMGKTSLALAALHHRDTAAKHTHRHFVPCHSSPGYSELVSTVASHLGLEQGPNLGHSIVQHFSDHPASFLILDNFETPWEPLDERAEVEEFLSLLADVPQLTVLVTMRGAERPAKVKWTRPCLLPLAPLSETAALQTFTDIADESHDEATVQQLLDLTGNLPLAVSLIANVAAYEGCETALARWHTERTRLLSDGFDKTSSLDLSIMLSLSSARMDAEAQKLLSLLAMLPDGLSDADLVQSALPIAAVLRCKATLLRTSLAYTDHAHRLRVLVPIREYVFTVYPPAPALKLALRRYFHAVLEMWDASKDIILVRSIPQISANRANLNRVFLDAVQSAESRDAADSEDMLASVRSVVLLSSFCRHSDQTRTPVMAALGRRIGEWRKDPVYGAYLIEYLSTLSRYGSEEAELFIEEGHHFFETPAGESQKGMCYCHHDYLPSPEAN